MEIARPRSLLVIKPSSFGDIIHTLPAVARLKAAWPECRISWLANTEWMPLLIGNPVVDEAVEFPRQQFRGWNGGWKLWRWARGAMAERRPDLALDFQGLLRSAIVGRTSRAQVFAGLSDAREGAHWFYHRTVVSPPQPIHAVERYLALAEDLLAGDPGANKLPDKTVRFPLPEGEEHDAATELLEDYVLVHPYSRGEDKSLSSAQINILIRNIRDKRIVLVGRGKRDGLVGDANCLNLLNRTTIPQLIWLARRASFVVSVDSGPAHLAAALGRPMVAIHSWSDPRKVGPYRADAWVWKNGTLTQVRELPAMDGSFFAPRALQLRPADLAAIAELATSPSSSSA